MKQRAPILIIVLLGLSLRLYHLGYHDLWYDEAKSISIADSFLIRPFFYAVLYFWTKIFGLSEFSVRFPALIFSTLSIPSLYALGKKLFNPKVAIIAAAIMALSPFQIWYGQEARHYSAGLFFSITSTYSLIMLMKGGRRYWIYLLITSVLGSCTGEFYLVLFLTQLLILVAYIRLDPTKSNIKSFLVFLLAVCLLLAPFFNNYLLRFNYIKGGFWIPAPDMRSLMITFENLLAGYNLSKTYYLAADILILLLLFAAFRHIYNDKGTSHGLYICLFLTALPIISIYVFSKFIFSIYLDRGMIVFSPYFYLLLSAGIYSLSGKRRTFYVYTAMCLLFCLGLGSFYQDRMSASFRHHIGTYIKKPVKPLIKFIDENSKGDDIIAFTNRSTLPSFRLFSSKTREYYEFYDPGLPDTDWNRPFKETPYCIPKRKVPFLKTSRIWVIASDWSHDGGLDEQSKSVKEYLDKTMNPVSSKNINGNWVFQYVK